MPHALRRLAKVLPAALPILLSLSCESPTENTDNTEDVAAFEKSISFPFSETWSYKNGPCLVSFDVTMKLSLELKNTPKDPAVGNAQLDWTQAYRSTSGNPEFCKTFPTLGPMSATKEFNGPPSQLSFQVQLDHPRDSGNFAYTFDVGFTGSESGNAITGTLTYRRSASVNVGDAAWSASGSTSVPVTIPLK